jgi:hypothetical protein
MSSLPYFSLRAAKSVSISASLETSHWKPLAPGSSAMRPSASELHALVLITDGQGCAGLVEFLGDAPGDGTLVGQPEDHGRLTRQIDHACFLPPMTAPKVERGRQSLGYQAEDDHLGAGRRRSAPWLPAVRQTLAGGSHMALLQVRTEHRVFARISGKS